MRKIFCVRVYDQDCIIVGAVVGDPLYVAASLRPSFDPNEIPYAFYEKLRLGKLVCSDRTALESDGSVVDFDWEYSDQTLFPLSVATLLEFGDDQSAAKWLECNWLLSFDESEGGVCPDDQK